MRTAPEDGFSFDPKTWVSPPAPAPIARPAERGRSRHAALSALLSALLLLSGAAAAYLTRTAAPAAAAAPR